MTIALSLISLVLGTGIVWYAARRIWRKDPPTDPIRQVSFIGATLIGWSLACFIVSGILLGLFTMQLPEQFAYPYSVALLIGILAVCVTTVVTWILDARAMRQEMIHNGIPNRPVFGWGGLIFLVLAITAMTGFGMISTMAYGVGFLGTASALNDPSFNADQQQTQLYGTLSAQAIMGVIVMALVLAYKIIKWWNATRNWDQAMAARQSTMTVSSYSRTNNG